MPIIRLAAREPCLRAPVTSTLGLAGGVVQDQRVASALRSRSQTSEGCMQLNGRSSWCGAAGSVQALCARQSQRSSSVRPGISSGGRFAPACCAAQSVCGRAAHGTPDFALPSPRTRRERAAAVRLPTSVRRWCVRGLTGRSTGGVLPRLPGYLYVRPRRRYGPCSKSGQCASVTLANPKRTRTEQFLSSGCRASYPPQALRARQCRRSSSMRPGVSSGRRFAPACCAAQSVCGRTAHGRSACLAVAVHAARKGGGRAVANVGSSAGASAA